VFLLVVLQGFAVGQEGSSREARMAQLSTLGKGTVEYKLGPGDLIEIGVFGVEFSHTLRVSASGLIKLPVIDAVAVSGMTAAELERKLASLLDGDVIQNPQVSVFVKEYRSQPVFVLGSVKTPGQYQIMQQLNIVDVLSMAGGLLPSAGDEVTIRRPVATSENSPDKQVETIKIDLEKLLESGDLSLNIPVQGGDVVNVVERQPRLVYIIGEVNRAGVFALPVKGELRVTQAFAWAGGPMKTAKMSKGILVRYGANGERQEMPVNFDQILKGKKEDFQVRDNDIIFVPGSKFKNIGYGILGTVPNAVANVPFIIP
jgi:polysaccharide export outer membrane protein